MAKKTTKAKRSKKEARTSVQRDDVAYGDVNVVQGEGGETHQTAATAPSTPTTAQGIPVADDQNWLTSGPRGPRLLEDFVAREKLFHFDQERIPERVHARGYGVKGVFETYEPIADLTRADLFQRKGETTDVFVRFSTVAGNKGSPDLARDVRGFAVTNYNATGFAPSSK